MNRSRLLLIAFGFLFTFGITSAGSFHPVAAAQASSQTSAKPASNPDAIENDDSLNLTQDQKDKIKSIRDDARKQYDAIISKAAAAGEFAGRDLGKTWRDIRNHWGRKYWRQFDASFPGTRS